jgi:hypothetical protein
MAIGQLYVAQVKDRQRFFLRSLPAMQDITENSGEGIAPIFQKSIRSMADEK